ncbi:acetyl-CoA carboxylase biotin carboxyl carrier protein [Novosphingobium sp.]|uniref:acetyl-CoA carboxylase biotin carboxyl carrier protein n=1 Tax=Novosphingobium sp. TaxID=1874826 RepID=UPI0025F9BB0B|nr:acetyl-CoA carboxylase biotin carboxyl carrier protein [Novosphingobium sp.]
MGQDGGNGSGKDSAQGSMMAIDGALVRELAELLAETGLSEIEVEDGPRKIRVARQLTAAPVAAQVAVAAPVAAAAAPVAAAAPATPAVSANAVKSPMVGTVYLSADPSSPPFVSVGKPVKEGETLLIIEAMKVMNPIVAPRSGMVSAILVENAQPVEYDQPLVVID